MLTDAWTPLRYHEQQSKLWYSPARFIAIRAGRGSGKTELGLRRLVRLLPVIRGKWKVHRYAYLGPTREQAKRIAWEQLKNLTPQSWLNGRPSESELCIRIKIKYADRIHEAELWVIGMDKPQRFEGKQWDGVFEDEAADQKPNIGLSIRPALSHRKGWWWKGGVPKRQGIGAKSFNKFCERGIKGQSGYEYYSWGSDTVLTQEEIEQAAQDLDEKDFAEQYKADAQTNSGACFYAFTQANVKSVHEYDPNRPIYVGSDFNVDPMAWILAQKTPDGTGLQVFDEIWLRDTYTQATLDHLWLKYGAEHKGGWFFHGDATAQNRKTAAATSDYAQIQQHPHFKARVLYPRAQPGVKDRLSSTNALLRNAAGVIRCWIHPKCEQLIADLEHRRLDSDGYPADKKASDEGHSTDALGYLIHWYWPAQRAPDTTKPKIGVFTGEG